ncbi:Vitamin K epoxide reductase [Streptomyces sp. NBC_00669]|uniref:vitamin K epoxide reductase family protein n=1 Tax=Streptomyces sp. NBC_00669 TaxID=2976011 RepID=UPI002E36D76B|nr:vitamin K epoxide reductase family protein [Streptomyces sp. NBC_00669]
MTTSALDQVRADGGDELQEQGRIVPTKAFTWLLLTAGALGLLASFALANGKFALLQHAVDLHHDHLSCSSSPVIACRALRSSQAHAFGFQNPIMGLVAYGVVICVAMGVLAGGRGYKPWFWYGLQAGGLFGVCFISWLQYQTIYNIHAVCLWCCLAWVVTILIFWYTAVHNIRHGLIKAPGTVRAAVLKFHWVVPVVWYAVIATLILTHFWYYWKTVI